MKPGCDRPVAARLTFDPVGRALWLDSPVDDSGGLDQMVCAVHAGGLTAPLGWSVTDRRSALRSIEEVEGIGEMEIDEVEEIEDEPVAPPEPSAKVRRRRASSKKAKLLDRAFEWTGPQHSVLTHRPDEPPPAD